MVKILIVEDEGILAFHLKTILERIGHEVVGIADNATDAMDIGLRKNPDIVFMDIIIKGNVTGKELAETECMRKGCKIIFMSGSSVSDKTINEMNEYPMLKKPFDESQVKSAIEEVLSE